MPQLVYRGDGIGVYGKLRLIKDQPQEISEEQKEQLKAIAEQLPYSGFELIIEPRPKRRPT